MKINDLKEAFAEKANADNAQHMAKYMRNQFVFYGLKTPERKISTTNF